MGAGASGKEVFASVVVARSGPQLRCFVGWNSRYDSGHLVDVTSEELQQQRPAQWVGDKEIVRSVHAEVFEGVSVSVQVRGCPTPSHTTLDDAAALDDIVNVDAESRSAVEERE